MTATPATRLNALDQLHSVTEQLVQTRGELALLEAARCEGWARTWMAQDSTSVSERDRVSDFQSVNFDSDIIKLKGSLRALEDERVYLLEVIHFLPSH